MEQFDVLIIGAGLSGVAAARYLKRKCPGKTFALLETKARIGGTWELFQYPGIRSDSDMHTMGYAFRPWRNPKSIADGASIRNYIEETAAEEGITPLIRFNHKVIDASWSSDDGAWTLTVDANGQRQQMRANFVFSCAGYYRHDAGYLPKWDGYENYKGTLIHPQFWPQDFDHTGKRIIVIGSGATAVTLTPVLSEKAAHVTQLQRSPSYVVTRPAEDAQAKKLRKYLPESLVYRIVRWRNILYGRVVAKRIAKNLEGAKRMLIGMVRAQLGPGYDVKKHFTPRYMPWEQRICMVPDGDMFKAIRSGRVTMVTDEIDRFTETGILTKSGDHIEADAIVTATGLELQFMGGVNVTVDEQAIDPAKLLIYKGFMYSNVPNLIYFTGYTNSSWTLKVDLVAEFACRILNRMQRKGARQATAVASDDLFLKPKPWSSFTSGYVVRAAQRLPKLSGEFPWKHEQNYFWDRRVFRYGKIEDGTLQLTGLRRIELPPAQRADAPPEQVAAE